LIFDNTDLLEVLRGGKDMDPIKLLEGKKILIVDDEPDVLDQLIELLDMCRIDTASSFEEGKRLLEAEPYDVAILDIMGVKGFELLEIAKKQKIPALMLTAHGLSEESLKKSAEEGASYFAPKEKMSEIDLFVADVLGAIDENKSPWAKWFKRLAGFYDKRFHGPKWREQEQEFWEKKLKKTPEV
jgi:DNA-binding NtrC family response regulator